MSARFWRAPPRCFSCPLEAPLRRRPARAPQTRRLLPRNASCGWAFLSRRGLTEIAEDGTRSGYTYDYLQEVAQYTGWEFEYVDYEGTDDEQISAALDDLMAGRIDVLGAMSYSKDLEGAVRLSGPQLRAHLHGAVRTYRRRPASAPRPSIGSIP